MKSRLLRLLAIFSLVLSLGACGMKLAYHFLDTIMYWELGKYVSLEPEQKKIAKSAFDEFHEWHRQHELPRYVKYLQHLKKRLNAGPISAKELHAESDKIQNLLDDSMTHLLPDMAAVARTFSDEQVEQFRHRLEKDQDDYRDEYLNVSREKMLKLRIRDLNDYIKPAFGSYSDEQEKWIEEWAANMKDYESLMLLQKQDWEKQFSEAMKYRQDPAELETRLKGLVLYRTDNWEQNLQDVLDYDQELSWKLIARLLNSRSDKQKAATGEQIDGYIKLFNDMHGLPKAQPQ